MQRDNLSLPCILVTKQKHILADVKLRYINIFSMVFDSVNI
jgi:hypothetical protein